MYFYKENFKKGPIIITSDRTLQTTNAEFDFIPKGAVLYDEDGIKYVKTSTGIEEIQ
jgi:predicted GNAT family N-acyltransferase